jgi:tRNA(fMet)-specific endonuclease VapC
MYLLDTDVFVYALRGHARVAEQLAAHVADPRALSVITYGELLYGAQKSARPLENSAKIRRLLELFPVVDVRPGMVETFASLKSGLEATGQKLDDFDLLIAATAIYLGYTLVTSNTRHFQRIPGLVLENWAA